MTVEYQRSLTELNVILNYMNIEHVKKIPTKFINFINNNMDKDYIPNINKNIPIDQQELRKDTKILLSLIYRNYWCDNELKKDLLNQDLINKKNFEQELREKYNPDNIFKNNQYQKENLIETHTELVEYKEPKWYQIIFKKILRLFKRK
jgi:hypothetical protein